MELNLLGKPFGKKDRNPFLILLLKKMIKSETSFLYNKVTENVADYLAIPRLRPYMTKEELEREKKNTDENELDRARSTYGKIIGRTTFVVSDLHISRILRAINFYGSFQSWEEFNKIFNEIASHYETCRGIAFDALPNTLRAKLEDDVYNTWREEKIFLEQSGKLEGSPRKNIFRIPNGYVLATADFDERMAVQHLRTNNAYGISNGKMNAALAEILLKYNEDIFYVLLNCRCKICAGIMFIPLDVDPFGVNKDIFRLNILAALVTEDIRSIYIQEIVAVEAEYFLLLLQYSRLAFPPFLDNSVANPYIITAKETPPIAVKYWGMEEYKLDGEIKLYLVKLDKLLENIKLYHIIRA